MGGAYLFFVGKAASFLIFIIELLKIQFCQEEMEIKGDTNEACSR